MLTVAAEAMSALALVICLRVSAITLRLRSMVCRIPLCVRLMLATVRPMMR